MDQKEEAQVSLFPSFHSMILELPADSSFASASMIFFFNFHRALTPSFPFHVTTFAWKSPNFPSLPF